MKIIVVFLLCISLYCVSGGVVPFITPCQKKDHGCLVSSAQKAVPVLAAGVPDMKLSPLDPVQVDKIVTNNAGLLLDFTNTIVTGLRKCVILDLKRQDNKMYIELKCSVLLSGDYTLGGKLLIMPVNGKGKYQIKIRDMIVKIWYELGEEKIGNNVHWKIKKWQQTSEVLTNVNYNFENLFNGNQQLAKPIQQFANENWKVIYQEMAPPIVQAIVSRVVSGVQSFFYAVPVKYLAIN